MQNINFDQSKLKHKKTTIFEHLDDSDVINKAYLDTKISQKEGHLSFPEKDTTNKKLRNCKQSVDEVLIKRAVKLTKQIL